MNWPLTSQPEHNRSRILQGLGASPGIATARVVVLKRHSWRAGWYHLPDEFVDREADRFFAAVSAAEHEMLQLRAATSPELTDALAIIDAHLLMLKDRLILERTAAIIRTDKVNAEWAMAQALGEIKERFDRIDDPYIKGRYADIKYVGDRLFALLTGKNTGPLLSSDQPAIIVANDFSPEDTLRMQAGNICGFLTEKGGRNSHTAIVARSLGLPAVVGLEHATGILANGDLVIMDGETGQVIHNPDPFEINRIQEVQRRSQAVIEDLERYIHLSSESRDGYGIRLSANIERRDELASVQRYNSEGIGLFRSEFDYFKGDLPPGEEELFAAYRQLLETMAPHPVTVRTLDVGGDKFFNRFPGNKAWFDQERNPALGLRSIRYCLFDRDLFRIQLRALLRASVHGRLRIMLPLVSNLAEIRQVRAMLAEIEEELDSSGLAHCRAIDLGIMVEVPSAVVMADAFAAEVDFFAIGTNDLIQYSLAIDRGNQYVAHLYDPLHPAVLRMIRHTVAAGHACNIPVSLCGEMAGDMLCAPVLIGLGLDELSMRPAVIPWIRRLLRHSDIAQLRRLSRQVLACADSDQVRRQLGEALPQIYPSSFYPGL